MHVLPGSQPRVHNRVVLGVEAGVRAVERQVVGQQVHSGERAGEWPVEQVLQAADIAAETVDVGDQLRAVGDRKSTRLNSSHVAISYAVFCLKKKTKAKHTKERKHYRI